MLQLFTAFYEHLRQWNDMQAQLNVLKLCCMCVSGLNTHFLTDYELNAYIYHWEKTIDGQKCHIDEILRQKTILNYDRLTCICAW